MIIGFAPKVIVLAGHGSVLSQQLALSSKRKVGKGAKRRAHDLPVLLLEWWARFRFAHPTKPPVHQVETPRELNFTRYLGGRGF
jgi:hypothetical protein